MHIESIQIWGYKALKKVEIPLRGLNVLIGPNGAGKSSLLEVLWLLSEAMNLRLGIGLSSLGGIHSVLTRDSTDSMHYNVKAKGRGAHPVSYTLRLGTTHLGYEIRLEEMRQQQRKTPEPPFCFFERNPRKVRFHDEKSDKLIAPAWDMKNDEAALAQIPRPFYKDPEDLRTLLASTQSYHMLDVSHRAPVRLPQELRPVDGPGANGEDLIAFLHRLRDSASDQFDRLEDHLRACFPGFKKLAFPLVAKGQAVLEWHDEHFPGHPFYQSELSEGTLRFLWLSALLLSPTLPAIVVVDEPEVSLHPDLLRVLAELLQEASQRCQILVATHADRLVRSLDPKEVLLCDKVDGVVQVRRAEDVPNLAEWLREYTLDQIWGMGKLGARP